MSQVRKAEGLYEVLWTVPNLFQGDGPDGAAPRDTQGQLVGVVEAALSGRWDGLRL